MKKVILFLWFGDEKPLYIQWTINNFKKINPGWEIRFIEYSDEQLKNYKEQNDHFLVKAIENNKCNHNSYVADEYRKMYLNEHKDECIVYCDLDCFPIAPFDNFMLLTDDAPEWMKKYYPNKHIYTKIWGCNGFGTNSIQAITPDLWCMINNNCFFNWHILQLHKGSILDDTLIIHKGMLMNRSAIPKYTERTKAFHEMKIELGDSFCLPQFTPIEHYYSYERSKLNIKTVF